MITLDRVYRVRARGELLCKEASTAPAAAVEKLAFWRDAKVEAETHPDGTHAGLVASAMSIWKQAKDAAEPVADSRDAASFAASYACAKTVDDCIEDMQARGDITPTDAEKLSAINASAAFDDLEKVAFGLGDLLAVIKQNPRVTGMAVGALIGAGVGALHDEENPTRGAIAGASLGTAVGALGGHVAADASQHGWFPTAEFHARNKMNSEDAYNALRGK
jgi:hypothetical protein